MRQQAALRSPGRPSAAGLPLVQRAWPALVPLTVFLLLFGVDALAKRIQMTDPSSDAADGPAALMREERRLKVQQQQQQGQLKAAWPERWAHVTPAGQPPADGEGSEGSTSTGAGGEQGELQQQEQPAEEAQPRYSTHTCINQKFDDYWHAATCKFDNVCLNAATLEFEYYLDPAIADIPVAYDQKGHPLRDFSPHMVNLGHARVDSDDHAGWAPRVVRRPFPSPGPNVRWAPVPQALLAGVPVALTTNFGHVLYDVLVPLFNMQHLFGAYTPAAQVLIARAVSGSSEELDKNLPRLINTPDPAHSLLRLTWDHDAAWLADYPERVLGEGAEGGLVCFQAVLAGTGALSRQMAAVDALPYRQAVVGHIGLQEPTQQQPVITILNKQGGRRVVENTDALAALLSERYPLARVQVVDFAARPDITMAEQVRLMSETSILVTPCGGLATVLTFLRPGATAIAMNYWSTLRNRSAQLEDIYYSHLEYLDIQYMPVTPDDYAGTSDRPACELVANGPRPQDRHHHLLGALVHCNLRLSQEGLRRLAHYVDAAMLRWAAQHGRYGVLSADASADARSHGEQERGKTQQQKQLQQQQPPQQQGGGGRGTGKRGGRRSGGGLKKTGRAEAER